MQTKPLDMVDLFLTRHQAETILLALGYRMRTIAQAAGYDKHLTPREVYEATGGSNGRDNLSVTERVFRDLYAAAVNVESVLEMEAKP